MASTEWSRPRRNGCRLLPRPHGFEAPRLSRLVGRFSGWRDANSGMHPDMVAIAELVCQACGEVTRSGVPRRTDTMPVCSCGGRRQLVRILHRLRNGERSDPRSYERLRR